VSQDGRKVGDAYRREERLVVFDVSITDTERLDEMATYVIRVNGRTVKTMKAWQAKRMGITREPEPF